MKRPSFQWYPSDWLRDTALRTCSVGARGLWIDMLCFMHEGNPYGTLKVGNKVILPVNLASMIGATLDETQGWLDELENAGVFDRGDEGEIMSRRMIRDENLRNIRAAGGKLGGNPALTSGKVNLKDNHKVAKEDKQKPTPLSSTSSSSSKELSKDNSNGGKSDLLRRAEKLFNRRESTQLDKSESKAYKDALPMIRDTTEEEWQMLERFYTAKDTFKRTSFATLLNNWNGEVQKAKDYHENGGKPRPIGNFGVRQPSTHATRSGYAEQEELEIPDA